MSRAMSEKCLLKYPLAAASIAKRLSELGSRNDRRGCECRHAATKLPLLFEEIRAVYVRVEIEIEIEIAVYQESVVDTKASTPITKVCPSDSISLNVGHFG